jgi:stage II sporulation protein R
MVEMVRRLSLRPYLYVAFALIVMIACWETNRAGAAVLEGPIPEQSIRLRILANSDRPEDQLLKRHIRDEVMKEIGGWMLQTAGIEDARETMNAHLPKLEQIVAEQLALYGYDYSYKVELGQVPFPAKMYGTRLYPAGDYEALRITIGKGEGKNWWCVLFPPLCFVDGKAGTVSAKKANAQKDPAKQPQEESGEKPEPEIKRSAVEPMAEKASDSSEVEVKFFVWELAKKIGKSFKGLFA